MFVILSVNFRFFLETQMTKPIGDTLFAGTEKILANNKTKSFVKPFFALSNIVFTNSNYRATTSHWVVYTLNKTFLKPVKNSRKYKRRNI